MGAIVCKLDYHHNRGKVGVGGSSSKRGYIAMLAVDERHRKRKIGSTLVRKAIHAMQTQDADEVGNGSVGLNFEGSFSVGNGSERSDPF